MDLRWIVEVTILIGLVSYSVSKSVRYGAASFRFSGQNQNKPSTSYVTSNDEEEESWEWGLFLTNVKHFIPSYSFQKFAQAASTAFIIGSKSSRTYYFVPAGSDLNVDGLDDDEICEYDIEAYNLSPNHGYFENPLETVVVYFLCQEYCCQMECCEINLIFLACVVFLTTLLLGIAIYCYCYRFARRLKTRRPQELAALKMYKSKFKNYADRVIFSEQQALQIFSVDNNPQLPEITVNGRSVYRQTNFIKI